MTPSDYAAARIKAVRIARGLTATELARRCATLGTPQLTRSVIGDIETGRKGSNRHRRRPVSVDELLTLALALNTPPLWLLVPPDDLDIPYPVTSSESETRRNVANWIRGYGPILPPMPLVGAKRAYYSDVPEEEFVVKPSGR